MQESALASAITRLFIYFVKLFSNRQDHLLRDEYKPLLWFSTISSTKYYYQKCSQLVLSWNCTEPQHSL